MIRCTRALLLQVGLPYVWWPYAPRCFAAIHNFVVVDEGSPFANCHEGNALPGPIIPLGALVQAMPNALHKNAT